MSANHTGVRQHVSALALLFVAAIAACSKPAAPPAAAPATADHAPSSTASTAPAPSSAGKVIGRIAGAGTAVVVLEPQTARAFPPQTDKPVMDQAGLTFGPELLVVRTGQPVEFRNSDDTLHNVNVKHEETREQAFNVAIPTGASYEHTFARDGFYRVGCDIHPAMAASIFSTSSPFATVADSDGAFTFAGVPAGAWMLTVYTGGRQLRKQLDVNGAVTEVAVE
jgi:plastocyanin